MNLVSLESQPLWMAIAVYVGAAAMIWAAGGRLSRYADQISKRTGIGGAVIGMVLLGAVTSLPEIATSTTATLGGDAGLAVSNLLGGVAFQIVVLAVVDAFIGRDALTSTLPNPSTMVQAMICILLLALAASGTIVGDVSMLGVGAWSTGMLVAYGGSLFLVRAQERRAAWIPHQKDEGGKADRSGDGEREQGREGGTDPSQTKGEQRQESARGLAAKTLTAAIIILTAGFLLTRSAEAIAGNIGLSTSLAGLTLLAVATSLPEVSTAISAVRLRRYDLAIGDVLGGNMFDIMLIFLVDALFQGPAVLNAVDPSASFAAVLAIVLTSIYLIGMVERRDRTVLKMGYDSLLVLAAYAGGIFLLFRMAQSTASG